MSVSAAFDATTGVRLYAPTASKASWRVVFTDPTRDNVRVQLYRRDETDARLVYVEAIEYLTAAAVFGPLPDEGDVEADEVRRDRNARRRVDDLMDSLEDAWVDAGCSPGYIRNRRSLYRTWVKPTLGALTVRQWQQHSALSAKVVNNVSRQLAEATVSGVIGLLSALVSQAWEEGWLDRRADPLAKVRRKHRRRGTPRTVEPTDRPTTAMVDALADAFDALDSRMGWAMPWLGLQARLAGRSGLRYAEQVALTPDSVLEGGAWLAVTRAWAFSRRAAPTLKKPKNNKPRRVPVPKSLRPALVERADQVRATAGPTGLLFPGRVDPTQPPSDSAFRRYFVLAAREAGWAMVGDQTTRTGLVRHGRPVIPYRNLRHHAAWWMNHTAGVEWADVSRYLGHHSVAFTLARYVRPGADADARNQTRMEDL